MVQQQQQRSDHDHEKGVEATPRTHGVDEHGVLESQRQEEEQAEVEHTRVQFHRETGADEKAPYVHSVHRN